MLSIIFVTQKVRSKRGHTRNFKIGSHPGLLKRFRPRISKKDHTRNFLLSLRLLKISQLSVIFSDSIFK